MTKRFARLSLAFLSYGQFFDVDRLSDMGKRSVLNYAAETQRMELKDSQVSSPVCCYKHVVEQDEFN